MIKAIKSLLEDYFNSTELMNMLLKNYEKTQKKAEKDNDSRRQFLITILGKITYNKYAKDIFAPIPLSALRIDYRDLYYLYDLNLRLKVVPEMNNKQTLKLFDILKSFYAPKEFRLLDNGGKTLILQTNIVFKRFDDIIDFFMNIQKAYKKTYKTDENINWKLIIKKFRDYLK